MNGARAQDSWIPVWAESWLPQGVDRCRPARMPSTIYATMRARLGPWTIFETTAHQPAACGRITGLAQLPNLHLCVPRGRDQHPRAGLG